MNERSIANAQIIFELRLLVGTPFENDDKAERFDEMQERLEEIRRILWRVK
jgi:hypothetical protein